MKPTQEQVIAWAREAGMEVGAGLLMKDVYGQSPSIEHIQAAIALAYEAGRKDENEACAKMCEDSVPTYTKDGERWLKGQNGKPDVRLKELAPNLEAAWEQEQLLRKDSALKEIAEGHRFAAVIRARREHG